jgi:hypothetical protein
VCGTTTAASSARGGVFRVHDSESIEVFGAVLKMFPEWAGRVVPFGFDWLGCQFALAAGFFEEWLAGAGKAPAWGSCVGPAPARLDGRHWESLARRADHGHRVVMRDEMSSADEDLYQVVFDLPDDIAAWAPGSSERLWVAKTPVRLEVEVRNTPFYVKGVSYLDRVRVRIDHERRELVFDEFVAGAGHSTVRVILMEREVAATLTELLNEFGCTGEIDAGERLWAIDVPPEVDYDAVLAELVKLLEAGKIEVQESALSKAHGGPLSEMGGH